MCLYCHGGVMHNILSIRRLDKIAVLSINNPPVNAITQQVRSELLKSLNELEDDTTIDKLIIFCEGKTFFSGGDISEFDGEPPEPHLPDVVNTLERSRLITIAALHGSCFGGGFEVALGCDYRIALEGTQFAFPEVNLGLIPGAGGTQRLPRLIGLEEACNMLASGRPSSTEKMYKLGAIDKIVDAPLLESAINFAAEAHTKPPRLSAQNTPDVDVTKIYAAYDTGADAPKLNISAARWSTEQSFEIAQPKERELHLKLRQSSQSKAFRHVFFAERKASKPKELAEITPRPLTRIIVVGGGLMGTGIAVSALMADKQVCIIEQSDAMVATATERVTASLVSAQKRGKLKEGLEKTLERFSASSTFDAAHNADLVIEAVFEDTEVKREVFTKIVNTCGPETILTTNTSYLNPEIIIPPEHHGRSAGLHFFAPAHIMKLIEVIKLGTTSQEVLASLFNFARQLNKRPVASGICDGFIGNRILSAYRRQADYLLADGALPHHIDTAMRNFGMPVGPYEMQDMSGLQIAWATENGKLPPVTQTKGIFPSLIIFVKSIALAKALPKGGMTMKEMKKNRVKLSQTS